MRRTFHIFINTGGHAHYVETVQDLKAARKRLRQVAERASGDFFLYSVDEGIVELIVRPDFPNCLQEAPKPQIVRGRQES